VVRVGVGLARELKRTMTISSRTSTKAEIAAISQTRKSWNQTIWSMTGLAESCKPNCHGTGCPATAAIAAPPAKMAMSAAATAANRLNTSIVVLLLRRNRSRRVRAAFASVSCQR